MNPRAAIVVISLFAAVLMLVPSSSIVSASEHFLDFSEDSFKVVFISGNLTAAVTHDWPRVVFQHTTALLAPTFEVGMPVMYLFNDSNGDGLFSRSEVVFSAYLDEHHNVTWNTTSVTFGNDSINGEYAQFRMRATISLFQGTDNDTAYLEDWANMTYWFRISEKPVDYSNVYGTYTVMGRIELRMNFTLEFAKHVDVSGIALEQNLKAGGSTYMFLIRESTGASGTNMTFVSSRVDQTGLGLNFTNRLEQTDLADQQVEFSKADKTVQAFYHFSSEPEARSPGALYAVPMNSSYYTTGTGLVVDTAYFVSNDTDVLTHDASLGLVESGFVSKVKDWFTKNLPWIMIISGSIVAVIALSILALMIRDMRRSKRSEQK